MRNLSRVAIFLFLFLLPLSCFANLNHLMIVEVQIAGEKSSNDFIKIYNPTDNDLDISGYKLRKRSSTGSESSIRVFPQGSKILAKGYFLWANSEGGFAESLKADAWSKQTLSKNNSLALFSPEGEILDALAWGESQNPFLEGKPFPENPEKNQKLERNKSNGIYQDTNDNSQDFFLNPPSKQIEIEKAIPAKSITYPSGIFFSEILPSPGGPDSEEEWIEIQNQNDFEADLSSWQIKDTVGEAKTYTFPQGKKISPQGFLVLPRPTSKITLNNDGDGLILLQPDGNIVDSVSYEKAPRGQSYNKINSEWVWSTILTPGGENAIPAQDSEDKEVKTLKEDKEIFTQKEEKEIKKELAAAGPQISLKPSSFLLIFLTGFTFSIFSAIIILILKQKSKKIDLLKNLR